MVIAMGYIIIDVCILFWSSQLYVTKRRSPSQTVTNLIWMIGRRDVHISAEEERGWWWSELNYSHIFIGLIINKPLFANISIVSWA